MKLGVNSLMEDSVELSTVNVKYYGIYAMGPQYPRNRAIFKEFKAKLLSL